MSMGKKQLVLDIAEATSTMCRCIIEAPSPPNIVLSAPELLQQVLHRLTGSMHVHGENSLFSTLQRPLAP